MIVLLLYDTAVLFINKLFAWNPSVCDHLQHEYVTFCYQDIKGPVLFPRRILNDSVLIMSR